MTVRVGAAWHYTPVIVGKSENTSLDFVGGVFHQRHQPDTSRMPSPHPSPIRCERAQIARVVRSDSPPAKQADAASPSDWPMTAAGLAP